MKKLTASELRSIEEYEKTRSAFRAFVVQAKQVRRMTLGPVLTVVFENRRLLHYELQESLRLRGVTESSAIEAELERFNALLPSAHELTATVFIEICGDPAGEEWLQKLRNVENCVALGIGGSINVRAFPIDRRTLDDRTSAVHYLKFRFAHTALEAMQRKKSTVRLFVDHPSYRFAADVPPALLGELHGELGKVRRVDDEVVPPPSPRIRPEQGPGGKGGES